MLSDSKEQYVVKLKCTTGSLFHTLYWEFCLPKNYSSILPEMRCQIMQEEIYHAHDYEESYGFQPDFPIIFVGWHLVISQAINTFYMQHFLTKRDNKHKILNKNIVHITTPVIFLFGLKYRLIAIIFYAIRIIINQ